MSENNFAYKLKIVGISTIVIGTIVSIVGSIMLGSIFYFDDSDLWRLGIAVVGSVVSFISGTSFIIFSELISLLKEHVENQKKILAKINNQSKDNTPETVLQDAESVSLSES